MMGDVSAEPSMEDILSSIKRIIAEEGDANARTRRAPRAMSQPRALAADDTDDDEVLELRDAIAAPPPPIPAAGAAAEPTAPPPPPPVAPPVDRGAPTAAVSAATVEATRGALDALSRLVVKPEPEGDGTLEGLVRTMLRPMLGAWLDEHLPAIVEQMVSREIAKITAGPR